MWDHIPDSRGTQDAEDFPMRYKEVPKPKSGTFTAKHLLIIFAVLLVVANFVGDIILHK